MNVKFLDVPADSRKQNDYFHPAVTALSQEHWILSFQRILDSDCYGETEYMETFDSGQSWSEPVKVPGLHNVSLNDNMQMAIADVRCFASADSRYVMFAGCDTVYTPQGAAAWDKKAAAPRIDRRGSYCSILDQKHGVWSERQLLFDPDLPSDALWRIACSQVAFTPDGDWLIPIYFSYCNLDDFYGFKSVRFAVSTIQGRIEDDGRFVIHKFGNKLKLELQRGLIEPSLIAYKGQYLLTIRAEDGNMYYSVSEDGLSWQSARKWEFDNGDALETSSTQQHWFTLQDKLCLAYTRNNGSNAELARFRAPMFGCEVAFDGANAALIKASEREILPRRQINGKDGMLGNFHVCNLPDGSAVLSDAYGFFEVKGDNIEKRYTELALAHISL